MNKQMKKFAGFTMIEVLIVLFIIAVLAIILIPTLAKNSEKAKASSETISSKIKVVDTDLDAWEKKANEKTD